MKNSNAIEIMLLLQFLSFIVIFIEKDDILKNFKKISKKDLYTRTFMIFVPLIVAVSLMIRPL